MQHSIMMAETHVDDPRLMRGGTVICPNCHTPMADDARFCTQCGTKLEPPQEQSASEGKKTARHVAIIVAACAIVLIAVVGLWSWREHQRQEELAQQAAYEYERQSVTIPLLPCGSDIAGRTGPHAPGTPGGQFHT